MIKRAVRNLGNEKRVFDVVVDDCNSIFIEMKSKDKYGKTKTIKIPWSDVVWQVESAQKAALQ